MFPGVALTVAMGVAVNVRAVWFRHEEIRISANSWAMCGL